MKKIIVTAALGLLLSAAYAETPKSMQFITDNLHITLYSTQDFCLPNTFSGSLVMNKEKRTLKFCWTVNAARGRVIIMDEDGDTGEVPIENFSVIPGI